MKATLRSLPPRPRALFAAAAAAAVCAAALAAFSFEKYFSGMPAAEVLRKLSGLRLAVELYRQEKRALPPSFADVLAAGKLEAVPALKLRRHRRAAAVRDAASQEVRDTGGWAYVNGPASPQFGLVYIDCSHYDEKGRRWSEF